MHEDYTSRLNAVAEQLRQHTKSMQQHAGNLMAKLREIEATAKKLEDELAESQIRRQVGELSSNEFDSFSKKAQREIARLEDDQERIADDLNRIRHMLGGRQASDDEDRPRTSQDFDELEFLKSVVGTSTPSVSPTAHMTPSGNSASAPPAPAARPATPAQGQRPQPAAPSPPPALTPPATPATPTLVPSQSTPSDGPLSIRSSGALEQPKTLKCAECGSMNYPSEWYCERCGAELAAI